MTAPDPAILTRKVIPWSKRPTVFAPRPDYRPAIGGAGAVRAPCPPLAPWLESAARHGYRDILMTGGWDAEHTPGRAWWVAPTLAGWSIDRYVPDPPSAVYERRDQAGGRIRVTVRMSGVWYGECADTGLIRQAHNALDELLGRAFDGHPHVMGTPARTGQDLLLRSLPEGVEYHPAPDDVREILAHNFGQGRMEFPAPEDAPPLSDLYLVDARWMYAAHVRNSSSGSLPVLTAPGQLVHDDVPDFESYRAGFYEVSWCPPRGWDHIGLIPMWDFQTERTRWPTNSSGLAWVTEPELRLAIAHGWETHITRRLLFAPQGTPGSDPCRTWADKLVKLRAYVDQGDTPVARLLSYAIRHILLDTVGSWHRADRRELHVTLPGQEDEVPEDAEDVTPIYEGRQLRRTEWYARVALDASQQAMYRPEWAAMVWGRARAALNGEALRYAPGDLVALRSDAIAARMTMLFVDDGKPGHFRLKTQWHFDPPRPCPHDETAWRTLTGGEE